MVVSFRRTLSGGLERVILGCGVGFYGLLGLSLGALMPSKFKAAAAIQSVKKQTSKTNNAEPNGKEDGK